MFLHRFGPAKFPFSWLCFRFPSLPLSVSSSFIFFPSSLSHLYSSLRLSLPPFLLFPLSSSFSISCDCPSRFLHLVCFWNVLRWFNETTKSSNILFMNIGEKEHFKSLLEIYDNARNEAVIILHSTELSLSHNRKVLAPRLLEVSVKRGNWSVTVFPTLGHIAVRNTINVLLVRNKRLSVRKPAVPTTWHCTFHTHLSSYKYNSFPTLPKSYHTIFLSAVSSSVKTRFLCDVLFCQVLRWPLIVWWSISLNRSYKPPFGKREKEKLRHWSP